jgi:hypothetical protein
VINKLEGGRSLLGVKLQAPLDNFSTLLTHIDFIWQPSFFDFLVDFSHIFSFIKSLAIEALVKGDSQSPYLRFFTILIFKKSFRRHIRRRANVVFQARLRISSDFAISKIYDLGLSVV